MKRIALILIVLLTTTSLFAGGKECNVKNAGKSVELTGTLVAGSGDNAKATFRTNAGANYTVCEETKASVLKLTGTIRVKGKVVNCGGKDELVITEAKKV